MCPSLTRRGRFDHEIILAKPDYQCRLDILKELTTQMRLNSNVKLTSIAEATVGFVGADLTALCTEAGLRAIGIHVYGPAYAHRQSQLPSRYSLAFVICDRTITSL
jgi:ATP-dependent 26S proteasome regulatory subunit